MAGPDRPRMTRRGFVTTSAVALGTTAISGVGWGASDADAAQTDQTRDRTAMGFVDAVLTAFTKHRVVGIGEGGTHGLQDHFDLLAALLHDPRLPAVVDDIVVEFGNAMYQSTVDRFVSGATVEDPDLRVVWRNTTQSPLGTWDQPVFEQFYRTVRSVNAALAPSRRFRVLLGDPPVDWSKITDPDELDPFMESNLVGSPATICRRIDQLAGLGFNYFMVSCATPGTPIELRQRMMTRFAEEICPRYSRAMRQNRAT